MIKYIFDIVLLIIVYFVFFYKRWVKKEKKNSVALHLMYIYICGVLCITLMPFAIPIPGILGTNHLFLESINWIPFKDVMEQNGNAILEVILNIIMFIPFGFGTTQMKKWNLLRATATAFLFSLGIELTQLLYVWAGNQTSRSCDVTDLLTNVFGAFLGYLLYIFCSKLHINRP